MDYANKYLCNFYKKLIQRLNNYIDSLITGSNICSDKFGLDFSKNPNNLMEFWNGVIGHIHENNTFEIYYVTIIGSEFSELECVIIQGQCRKSIIENYKAFYEKILYGLQKTKPKITPKNIKKPTKNSQKIDTDSSSNDEYDFCNKIDKSYRYS